MTGALPRYRSTDSSAVGRVAGRSGRGSSPGEVPQQLPCRHEQPPAGRDDGAAQPHPPPRRHRPVHEITGDRNPLHDDAELAAASRFGGIIVQGGVTSGLLNALVAEDLPGPGTVFLHVDWSFTAPARPGDTITAEVEVLARRDDKPVGTLRTAIVNQHGTVLLHGTAVVYREPLGHP